MAQRGKSAEASGLRACRSPSCPMIIFPISCYSNNIIRRAREGPARSTDRFLDRSRCPKNHEKALGIYVKVKKGPQDQQTGGVPLQNVGYSNMFSTFDENPYRFLMFLYATNPFSTFYLNPGRWKLLRCFSSKMLD